VFQCFKKNLENGQNPPKRKILTVSDTSYSKPYSVKLCVHLEATIFGLDIDNHQAKNTQFSLTIVDI
jgi:hypothetical protein